MRMFKSISVLAILLMLGGAGSGCRSDFQYTPYQAGRDVTTGYLVGKESLKESEREAVKAVYEVFNSVMESIEDGDLSTFREKIYEALDDQIDDEQALLIAKVFADRAWFYFEQSVDWEELQNDRRYLELKEFHRGIEDVLVEFGIKEPDDPDDDEGDESEDE